MIETFCRRAAVHRMRETRCLRPLARCAPGRQETGRSGTSGDTGSCTGRCTRRCTGCCRWRDTLHRTPRCTQPPRGGLETRVVLAPTATRCAAVTRHFRRQLGTRCWAKRTVSSVLGPADATAYTGNENADTTLRSPSLAEIGGGKWPFPATKPPVLTKAWRERPKTVAGIDKPTIPENPAVVIMTAVENGAAGATFFGGATDRSLTPRERKVQCRLSVRVRRNQLMRAGQPVAFRSRLSPPEAAERPVWWRPKRPE